MNCVDFDTEGVNPRCMNPRSPKFSGGGVFVMTTKGSWLPWGRVAKPLDSPMATVPTETQWMYNEYVAFAETE